MTQNLANRALVRSSIAVDLETMIDWRVTRPVINLERCTHCWICFVNCPDGAIARVQREKRTLRPVKQARR